MLTVIPKIYNSEKPDVDLVEILNELHTTGPKDSFILEKLALYKEFHPIAFAELEEQIISALGLFYKIKEPENLYSLLLSSIGEQYKKEYNEYLTPVQASVRDAVKGNQFISISAPTSAGKSYSIRDYIAEQTGDAVIIVPSRALIAEYVIAMKQSLNDDKTVMIMPFVDHVFTKRVKRRIFVLTPERAKELFVDVKKNSVTVFFFDEAQISEDKNGRGIVFDVLVRRIKKHFPKAKLIFAHPFVENPIAQFKKHNINEQAYSRSYPYGAVGKISVYKHANGKDMYFSPYISKGHLLNKCVEFGGSFEKFAFNGAHSLLIYVSKSSIYSDKFLIDFKKHIDNYSKITDPRALEIIDAVRLILGANANDRKSKLVTLLEKGVVIHHGSVPLEVRFLVENFIRSNFAKICFATNTLAQGVNMPFDIVWLKSMRINAENESDRSLHFKNLIGRAGRLSSEKKYDYGYVYTSNPILFSERVNNTFTLNETSIIDSEPDLNSSEDDRELITAIKDGAFDDEYNIPVTKVQRLSSAKILQACKTILDIIYATENIHKNLSGAANKEKRKKINDNFKLIFEISIDRLLFEGETIVFDTAISIFLMMIRGKTFSEIVGLRYSHISKRKDKYAGEAAFTAEAQKLPDSTLRKKYSLFAGIPARSVNYDAVVFDTYDYMDQVISFSLNDVFSAAFKIYLKITSDVNAQRMLDLLRFGTNNPKHMLLMRYGFSPEYIEKIIPYIASLSEQNIAFNADIKSAPKDVQDATKWYRSQ